MSDETALEMYKSATAKLTELLDKAKSIREQISHWTPIVERLAKLTGETVDPEILRQVNEIADVSDAAGQEMGLTEAIRWVFRQPLLAPLTPTQVRDRLAEMGYDLKKYAHVMPPIHNTLNRMKEAGEIREVIGVGGLGKAFVSAR